MGCKGNYEKNIHEFMNLEGLKKIENNEMNSSSEIFNNKVNEIVEFRRKFF